jgi:hypothetical protein
VHFHTSPEKAFLTCSSSSTKVIVHCFGLVMKPLSEQTMSTFT